MGKDAAVWTEGLVDKFVELCMKEVDNNNRLHTHFNPKGWENLCSNFTKETGKTYTKKQLKNKWDGLKADWILWKDLKGKETGLGWDPMLQTIDASDEWWNVKMQSACGEVYGKLRKKGLSPDFEAKLDMLFMSIVATGSYAYSPSSSLPIPTDEVLEVDLEEGSGDSDSDEVGDSTNLRRQINRMLDLLESTSTSIKRARAPTCLSMLEVMDIVKDLPGMVLGSPLFMFTTSLFQRTAKREMFCALKDPMLQLEFIKYEHAERK